MMPQRKDNSRIDRRGLTQKAMKAAVKTRARAGVDQMSPVCIFDLCEKLGVTVRFTDINIFASKDGTEAYTIDEIVDRVCKLANDTKTTKKKEVA